MKLSSLDLIAVKILIFFVPFLSENERKGNICQLLVFIFAGVIISD